MIAKTIQNVLTKISVALFLILCNCSNDENGSGFQPSIDAANLPAANRPMTMFADDENISKMYDKTDRWFRVNEPLQVILKGKDSIQLSLYSPLPLTDVKIYAQIPNQEKKIVLFHFTNIPAFHRSFHKIPLATGSNNYLSETGETITIEQMSDFSEETIQLTTASSDPLFAKFKKIKSSQLVQFDDSYHVDEPGKFLPMNPALAKEVITLMLNFSYALSHPIYYETFMHFDTYLQEQAAIQESTVTGATNWHGNNADVDGNYDYYTQTQIEQQYNKYIDSRKIYPAMVGGSSALGGGALVSVWESSYVTAHWLGDVSAWSHEYSHHTGYNHDSNLANSGQGGGQQKMMSNFYAYLMYLKDLPFTNPEILKTWTKSTYLNKKDYSKPVFSIDAKNPFLVKYKGAGAWQ
ncbi:hypothetical protein [Flavobacterium adhaerens]|uniref:hypothetical protein n=1 Tax=Flavobacterium adhaerens TaxID=3149043 RepID=UPI0032B5F167